MDSEMMDVTSPQQREIDDLYMRMKELESE